MIGDIQHEQQMADFLSSVLPYRMQPHVARMFLALWVSKGRIVPYGGLVQRIWNMTSEAPSDQAMRSGIQHLRNDLRKLRWPVSVHTVHTVGFFMEVTEPGWTWERGR